MNATTSKWAQRLYLHVACKLHRPRERRSRAGSRCRQWGSSAALERQRMGVHSPRPLRIRHRSLGADWPLARGISEQVVATAANCPHSRISTATSSYCDKSVTRLAIVLGSRPARKQPKLLPTCATEDKVGKSEQWRRSSEGLNAYTSHRKMKNKAPEI